jgi:hypothetical protein
LQKYEEISELPRFGEKVRIGRSIFGLLQASNYQAVAKVYPHVYPHKICFRLQNVVPLHRQTKQTGLTTSRDKQ